MLAYYQDVTEKFNAGNGFTFDMSNYDYAVLQFVLPTGTINIQATIDGGASTAPQDAQTATNFQSVQATNLASGASVTSVAAAGLYRVGVVGRYVRFGGASAAATKVLLMLAKIS